MSLLSFRIYYFKKNTKHLYGTQTNEARLNQFDKRSIIIKSTYLKKTLIIKVSIQETMTFDVSMGSKLKSHSKTQACSIRRVVATASMH